MGWDPGSCSGATPVIAMAGTQAWLTVLSSSVLSRSHVPYSRRRLIGSGRILQVCCAHVAG